MAKVFLVVVPRTRRVCTFREGIDSHPRIKRMTGASFGAQVRNDGLETAASIGNRLLTLITHTNAAHR